MTRRCGALAVVLALAVAVGAPACGQTQVAATVDGERIENAMVDRDLGDIAKNSAFLEARAKQGLAFKGAASGTYDAAVVAEVVDGMVTAALVRHELARRGLAATPADVSQARDGMRRQFVDPATGATMIDGFPGRYLDEQARVLAESDVLEVAEGKVTIDDAALHAGYDAGIERFRVWCVSWIVSAPADPEAADRAAAALAAGEDFATVAQRESADTRSAGRGGALGCQSRSSLAQLGERFAAVATTLKRGELSAPTDADFGRFLVQVTDVKVRPFDEVRSIVRAQLMVPAQQPYQKLLRALRSKARVKLAARFGTWDRTNLDNVKVLPPGGRPSTTVAGAPTTVAANGLTGLPGGSSASP